MRGERRLFSRQYGEPANLPVSKTKKANTRPLTDADKARMLGGAIVEAFTSRGAVSIQDGTQAGLSRAEVERLWDDGMVEARRIEPRLPDMVAS